MNTPFFRRVLAVALLFATPAVAQQRIGVAFDVFGEGSTLNREQWINNTQVEQPFDYNSGSVLSGTVYLLFQTDVKRLRWGPGVRVYGNYEAAGNNSFGFGVLNEALLLAEYGIPAIEKFELVLGGRVGVPVLIPGDDFAREISRLQSEGLGVWSLPRVGWVGGLNVGARREMAKNLWLRVDLLGQLGSLYLFATDQRVDTLRVRKFWSTYTMRLGLTFTLELGL